MRACVCACVTSSASDSFRCRLHETFRTSVAPTGSDPEWAETFTFHDVDHAQVRCACVCACVYACACVHVCVHM